MFKLLKFFIGCVVFFLAVSIVVAAYERWNGDAWYSYKNAAGERLIIGQTERTTFQVFDENGNLVDTVPGWQFKGAAPNSYIKDSSGKLRFKTPPVLPKWMEITDTVLQPFLSVGHAIVDNVVNFIVKMT
jgi:hypothetical protein